MLTLLAGLVLPAAAIAQAPMHSGDPAHALGATLPGNPASYPGGPPGVPQPRPLAPAVQLGNGHVLHDEGFLGGVVRAASDKDFSRLQGAHQVATAERSARAARVAQLEVQNALACERFSALATMSAPEGGEVRVDLPVALQGKDVRVSSGAEWVRSSVADEQLVVAIEPNTKTSLRTTQLSVEAGGVLCVVEVKQPSEDAVSRSEARKEADHRARHFGLSPSACPSDSECSKRRWYN